MMEPQTCFTVSWVFFSLWFYFVAHKQTDALRSQRTLFLFDVPYNIVPSLQKAFASISLLGFCTFRVIVLYTTD